MDEEGERARLYAGLPEALASAGGDRSAVAEYYAPSRLSSSGLSERGERILGGYAELASGGTEVGGLREAGGVCFGMFLRGAAMARMAELTGEARG